MCARSSSFSSRAQYRDLSCTRSARSRVSSRSRRISYGGTNDGCSRPFSVSLASHTASFLSVLARPGTFLTARALTSCTFSPAASRITKLLIRQPGTHHPGRLGDVDRGDPIPHPLVLLVRQDLLRFFHGPGTSLMLVAA